ncbi:hypothetical protein ALC53_08495 [Atta colombica]|uniref:Uncharacterized protein n=1 Tax=Atta colombica TaxID=520822 RepID=A0A195BA95_9HYME|nr:hypothetical protein ALC53_08495 [Atta colombica]
MSGGEGSRVRRPSPSDPEEASIGPIARREPLHFQNGTANCISHMPPPAPAPPLPPPFDPDLSFPHPLIVAIQILFRDRWIHKSFESMGHSSPSRYSLAPPCISVSLTRTKRNALLGNSVVRRCGRRKVPGRVRGIWEDKRMALGRFTAGWLLQIKQVRCFDAKKRHRSLATWWRGGQWPPQTRFVEVSTRGGEPRPVTLPRARTCLKFPSFIPFILYVFTSCRTIFLSLSFLDTTKEFFVYAIQSRDRHTCRPRVVMINVPPRCNRRVQKAIRS